MLHYVFRGSTHFVPSVTQPGNHALHKESVLKNVVALGVASAQVLFLHLLPPATVSFTHYKAVPLAVFAVVTFVQSVL